MYTQAGTASAGGGAVLAMTGVASGVMAAIAVGLIVVGVFALILGAKKRRGKRP